MYYEMVILGVFILVSFSILGLFIESGLNNISANLKGIHDLDIRVRNRE